MTAVVTSFVEIITSVIPTIVAASASGIVAFISGIFVTSGETAGLSTAGALLGVGVGIACAFGLGRMAWNFFANIGHR